LIHLPWKLRPRQNAACPVSSSSSTSKTSTAPVSPSPLPTLTTTALPSNCISTAITTQCALGPGGQTACVTSELCTATSTSTPPPPPTPTPSPYIDCQGSVLCSTLQVKYCDHAVNTLNDDQDYGTEYVFSFLPLAVVRRLRSSTSMLLTRLFPGREC
jgi:hypothetical protein